MSRISLIPRFRGLFAAFACTIGGALLAAPNPTWSVTAAVHDPGVIKDGSNFYVFGSHLASASSPDLMNWTQISSSVANGNPLIPSPFTELSEVLAWAQTTTLWAPEVIKLGDGRFYYYYCACKGDSPRSGLGLAIANSVTGPYVNQGLLLKSGMWGLPSPDGKVYDATIHPNVVDPCVFWDKSGGLWMVYGSYSGGIFILEMDATTGLPKPNQAYGKKLMGGNHSTIEGPCIFYHPESDYYYLFVTYGGLDAAGGYNIRVSRSRSPNGPFLDSAGTDMVTVMGRPGTLFDNPNIAPHGVKLMGNYQFVHVTGEPGSVSRGYLSPGGSSIHRDPATGTLILVIHERFVGRGEQHEVRTYQLHLNADGWLVAAPHRYAKEAIATVDSASLVGQYKFINHGKDITSAVKYSTLVELKADGTVTGTMAGTWSISGDHFATLVLDGVTYKGVFAQNWDEDNLAWARTFSVLSPNGLALWGSKVVSTTSNTSPTLLSHPASQSVNAGATVSFTVSASGTPAPTYQWRKNGVNIAGATGSTYSIQGTTVADAGSYCCVVGNSVTAYLSNVATLSVTAPPAFAITQQPVAQNVTAGAGVSLSMAASGAGLTYQWRKYDSSGVARAVAGATASTLSFAAATSEEAGSYDCLVTQGAETLQTQTAAVKVAISLTSNSAARLVNISARTTVKTGAEATVVGFVVNGSGTEDLLIRAAGPALAPFGVRPTLADPTMDLFNQADTSTPIAQNDDWGTGGEGTLNASFTRTEAFSWASGSADAALLRQVSPGDYTAVVKAKGTEGIGLVELYEDVSTGPRLVNLSARAVMGSGQDALIAGFVVKGTGLKTLLIRVAGPALQQWLGGYAADPILKIFNQNNTEVPFAVNDDWDSDTASGDQINTIGTSLRAFSWARGSADAAILVTLRPGSYTAQGSTKSGTGIALVEVYEVNP